MSGSRVTGPHFRLLLRLDRARIRGSLRSPRLGPLAGVVLPAGLAAALLWVIGRASRPGVHDAEAAVLLSLLVAGPVAYLAYGTLFRAADAPVLRRLGLAPRAICAERAARYLAQALGVSALALVPIAAAGNPLVPALATAVGAAVGAWGAGVAAASGAGLSLARHRPGAGWGCLMAGIWDRDVAAAAPLAYAPLPPFLAGAVAGTLVFLGGWLLVPVAVAALAAAMLGARWYARALPRFGPQALEMAFVPDPATRGAGLRVGRGIARLMPRHAAAVWARDAVVAARRFPWAARVAWPVAIGGFFGLARWGESPATRGWVVGATLLALLVQALAGVGLGRLESAGRRWLDRSAGIGAADRWLGRWAWGWGLSLWMTIPVALAWTWWSGAPGGWHWLFAGGVSAALAATAAALAAGWR